ncbi:chorismate mutase [Nonomuraea turkmeniaca]|uniref:Chorismate mutase n=1 Tax=Nonomuraea turkmeniaca TaxID=103838 RepID=A0A5S4FHM9_9ACTN|nr:chorismate mutase [Nonomuraea turkmeniaca]TMR08510.1 chorismate mutase [Nonomuraea turkmeniaca]
MENFHGRTRESGEATAEDPSLPDPFARKELQRLRDSIDNLDAALVHLLAERFKCTKEVGRLKAEHRLPPADPERETRQIQRLRKLAEESKLDPVFAERFLGFIIEEVVRHHELIAGSMSAARED